MEQPILRAKDVYSAVLRKDEIPVAKDRLAELERKERAHDAYLEATRRIGDRQTDVLSRAIASRPATWSTEAKEFEDGYWAGWLKCLNEFSEAVIDAGRER